MSDKTMKKDIKPTGQSPSQACRATPTASRAEPSDSPKIMGPMAQDVAKVAPGAVKKIGGKLAVHAPTLAAFTPGPPFSMGGSMPKSSPGVAKGISSMSAFMPKPTGQATTAMRAGSRGIKGALSNTKLRPKLAGGLSA